MTKAIHVAGAVVEVPVMVVVAWVESSVVHRQGNVADRLGRSIDENVAAIHDIHAGLELILPLAVRARGPGAEQIVGGAVLLNDDNNVLESSRRNGLGGRERRAEEQKG
jgi:hypothetical protein